MTTETEHQELLSYEQQREQWQRETVEAIHREHVERTIERRVPARYRDTTIDHPEVQAWVDQFSNGSTKLGLLLTGPTGVGKTHQAYAALIECVRRSEKPLLCRAGSVPTLLNMCRPGNKPMTERTPFHEPTEIDIADEMEHAGLLLLDDLGAEKPSDWTGEILYRVIDERYMNLRPTIVVSNVPPRELAATIGDRLASRLTEMCRPVVMKGNDRRRQR